jgi:phosphoglycolate phosphatase
MHYDLIIFDLDGTLADSFPFFVGVHNRLASRHGFRHVEAAEVEALRGLSVREMMRRVGLPRWKLPWVARSFVRLMHEEGHRIATFDGVEAVLRELDASGIAQALVSSNSAGNARRVLGEERWRRFAHVECGASIFGKRRRIARVLAATGVPARRALYVGDQLTDAEAARAAGVAFGAVGWGYASLPSLLAMDPDVAFARVEDLRQLARGRPASPMEALA